MSIHPSQLLKSKPIPTLSDQIIYFYDFIQDINRVLIFSSVLTYQNLNGSLDSVRCKAYFHVSTEIYFQ